MPGATGELQRPSGWKNMEGDSRPGLRGVAGAIAWSLPQSWPQRSTQASSSQDQDLCHVPPAIRDRRLRPAGRRSSTTPLPPAHEARPWPQRPELAGVSSCSPRHGPRVAGGAAWALTPNKRAEAGWCVCPSAWPGQGAAVLDPGWTGKPVFGLPLLALVEGCSTPGLGARSSSQSRVIGDFFYYY